MPIAFDSMCKAIGVSEDESFIMPTAFTSHIFVRLSFKQAEWFKYTEQTHLDTTLVFQEQRILSNLNYLAFRYDPLYADICEKLMQKLGAEFLTFDNLSLIAQYYTALQSLVSSRE